MAWYWWVLIIAAVAGIGYLKLVFFKKWQGKKQAKKPNYKKEDE